MSPGGFIGLDPDLTVAMARSVEQTAETAAHVADEVSRVLGVAQIADNGVTTLCHEIDEELRLLGVLLRAKATQMELADVGLWMDGGYAQALDALWASLGDDVGEGIDFSEDETMGTGGVPMSSTVAATQLAEYLRLIRDEDGIDGWDLREIVGNEDLPVGYRAAAQYFLANGSAWSSVLNGFGMWATAENFEDFVKTNAALVLLAENRDRWDTAKQGDPAELDGYISWDDLQVVLEDTTGMYSEAEKDAVRWLIEHGGLLRPWESREQLTIELVNRQIFSDHPELAAVYLETVSVDPGAYLSDSAWFDEAGANAWLNAALSSTADPARQAELLLTFASVYQATKPEDVGLLDVVHELLDWVSFIDPFQVADAANAGIYLLEGDNANAAIAAGGMLLPIGGGKVIKLTRDGILNIAAHQSDELTSALLVKAIKQGDLTSEVADQMVRDVAAEFGDDTARAVREYLDDLAAQAARTNRLGREYPSVLDPRTGAPIHHPGPGLPKVPLAERVPWGGNERAAYIKEWYDRGYPTPDGGWANYDIHHIQPREYGGTNSFDNLVPVPRQTHQDEFNAWWRDY